MFQCGIIMVIHGLAKNFSRLLLSRLLFKPSKSVHTHMTGNEGNRGCVTLAEIVAVTEKKRNSLLLPFKEVSQYGKGNTNKNGRFFKACALKI